MAQPPAPSATPLIRALIANHAALIGRWGEAAAFLQRLGVRCEIHPVLPPRFDPQRALSLTVQTLNEPGAVMVLAPARPTRDGPIFDRTSHLALNEFLRSLSGQRRLAFVGADEVSLSALPDGLQDIPAFSLGDQRSLEELAAWARDAARASPTSTSSSSAPATLPSDSLPLSALSSFNLSPAAQAILDRAKAMTPPGGRWATLSTLAFLFAFKELGRETPQNEDTIHFVHRYLDREAPDEYQNLYETTVRTWIEDSPPDVGTDQPPGQWVTTITPNVLRLFERAQDISERTVIDQAGPIEQFRLTSRQPDEVHSRHLFAALLTFEPAPGTPNNILAKLTGLGLDLTALKTAFFEVVTANTPEDSSDAWRAALGLPPAERSQVRQQTSTPSTAQSNAGGPTPPAGPGDLKLPFTLAPTFIPLLNLARRYTATIPAAEISTTALLFALGDVDRQAASTSFLGRALRPQSSEPWERARFHYFPREAAARNPSAPLEVARVTGLSAEATEVFRQAERMARATNAGLLAGEQGDPAIHAQHLALALAATAAGPGSMSHAEAFERLGITPGHLARAIADAVRDSWKFDRRAGWKSALAPFVDLRELLPDAYQVAFSADQNDTDKLNLEHEIDAFAYLIASTGMRPPLSIGLFGEWGSGKSFFMARLRDRINALAKDARGEEAAIRRANPAGAGLDQALAGLRIHRHICQIEFNAWHYVEGNIWASLVENIFSNLQAALIDPKAPELEKIRQQEELKKQLGFAQQARADLVARLDSLDAARREAERKVDEAKKEHLDSSIALAKQLARDVWNDVGFSDKDNPGQLRDLLKQAGFPESALDAPKELYTVIQSIRTTGGWFRAQFAMLAEAGPDAKWYRSPAVRVFAGATVVALAFAALLWLLQAGALAGVVAVITQLAGVVGGITVWLSRQASRMNRLQRAAEPVFNSLERKLAAAEEDKQRNVAVLEKDAQQRSAILLQARGQLDQLDQDISRLQAQIRAQDVEPDATKVLAQFIEERAACTDYRRHLGITAVIRRDFEKLASLISSRTRPGARAESSPSVDRIVLYIDDLDRCPPDKVVAVLEAIHLILAFELFVVVVGVDARWVSRSLRSKYGALLSGRSRRRAAGRPEMISPDQPAIEHATPAAVPEDYLEKIFHIPFRLRPLQPDDAARLIKHLATPQPPRAAPAATAADTRAAAPTLVEVKPGDQARAAVPVNAGAAARAGQPQPDGPAAATTGTGLPASSSAGASTPAATMRPPDPANAGSGAATAVGSAGGSGGAGGGGGGGGDPTAEVNVSILHLTDDELKFMQQLAPIVGRSPRAVFRFVNCYRVHKAARPPAAIPEFEASSAEVKVPPYEAAMLILALVIGAPEIAQPMLSMLIGRADPEHAELHKLIADWERDPAIGPSPEWKRIAPFLRLYDKGKDKPCPIAPFRDAAAAVARYSFRTGMMEDLDLSPGIRGAQPGAGPGAGAKAAAKKA